MTYKQRGRNDKYPAKIEVWRIGDKVPEWLSDRAKVKFIDGEGNVTLDRRDRGDGSYEIIGASGVQTLVTVEERSGVVCFGDGRIFSLRERQFEILYERGE
jgi:hypothetical protein